MSKAVIVGATSGIGYEIALILLKNGWELGVAGRRLEKLQKLKALAPDRVHIRVIDVRDKIAAEELSALIDELEGMDLYIHSSGIGCQNVILNGSIELAPILGLSDVIVDIVETGTTLKENDLVPFETITPISARLIANQVSYKFQGDIISAIAAGLKGQVQQL